jgi:hypothetical protein
LRLLADSSTIRPQTDFDFMQRNRAIAIAAAERKVLQDRLMMAAALLLLPALLLLLISP